MQKNRAPTERLLLGAHMSIAGGMPEAVRRARRIRANVMQVFVKNNNQWKGRLIDDQETECFKKDRAKARLVSVVAHNSYLINLASPDERLWKRSINAMLDELERCQRLGLDGLVSHPGAHRGEGEDYGIRRIARALNRIQQRLGGCPVPILLETTAGQGTSLGYRFGQLRDILCACKHPERIGICLDTCHVFAAGYDFRDEEGYQEMMDQIDRTVGLDKLALIHVNDSKRELGSRVDRHQHIGKGQIGKQGFAWIVNDERLRDVPKILETPKDNGFKEDIRNMRTLRRLIAPTAKTL